MVSNFFQSLELELSRAANDFTENIDRINRRSSKPEFDPTLFLDRIAELESKQIELREEVIRLNLEKEKLEFNAAEYLNVSDRFEKRISLLQSENAKLRLKLNTFLDQQDSRFDEQKYRRALVYIEQLQAKLSQAPPPGRFGKKF